MYSLTRDNLKELVNIDKYSCEIDGVCMPKKYLKMQDDVANWKVNENDVWVVSFPKTGTTWTQEMVWLLLNDLDYQKAQLNLIKRSPQLEATALLRSHLVKVFLPIIPQPIKKSLKYVKKMSSPACIKTHLPWNLLPMEIQKDIKKPKIIYISRNPKDTCISYYHFSRLIKEFDGTLEEFCEKFLAGKVNFAPFWNHVLPFWERRHDPNILFLKYEDMKRDLPSSIRKVAEFLDKNISDEHLATLADHLSFENMKNNPAVNYDWLVKMSNMAKRDGGMAPFMRQGKVGGYKEVLTKEMIEKFEIWTKEHTIETGLNY
ncbi:hypothetical protein ABEB36_011981 [Hypothenemus hampei]|uniref:Sulfotransferase domain-containing protein n=1 Tax=Hypothenemus hampei TaxID=57062 RepID=A0ABD1ECB3_HYPHA